MKATYSVYVAATAVLLALSMPLHASTTDDRIESTAKESYVFKTFLKGEKIKIESKNGAVTLTGIVEDAHNRLLAQETVAALPGVKSVDNKLEVKTVPPPAENSDAWLKTKVKATLLFHPSVSGFKTEVDVKDRIVTLRGEAPNRAQIDLTTEYASDVEGIRGVNNKMTVAKAQQETAAVAQEQKQTLLSKIDDASITAQVKMALLYHRSTSGLHTSVTTNDGVVTLSGKAENAAEMDLAAKYASDIHGVKSVKNRMTIK